MATGITATENLAGARDYLEKRGPMIGPLFSFGTPGEIASLSVGYADLGANSRPLGS